MYLGSTMLPVHLKSPNPNSRLFAIHKRFRAIHQLHMGTFSSSTSTSSACTRSHNIFLFYSCRNPVGLHSWLFPNSGASSLGSQYSLTWFNRTPPLLFEHLATCSLYHLYLMTAFLVVITSFWRIGEIQVPIADVQVHCTLCFIETR